MLIHSSSGRPWPGSRASRAAASVASSAMTKPAEPGSIRGTVYRLLSEQEDKWDLRHFRQRVDTYYLEDTDTVLALLDALAAAGPLTMTEVISQVKHRIPVHDERARELLGLLQLDHYLERSHDGLYRFRFEPLRRWWRYDRGL